MVSLGHNELNKMPYYFVISFSSNCSKALGSILWSGVWGPLLKIFGGQQENIKGPDQWNLETLELKGNQPNTHWINPYINIYVYIHTNIST